MQQLARQSERLQQLVRPEMVQNQVASFVKPDGSGTSITIIKPGAAPEVSDLKMKTTVEQELQTLLREGGTIVQDVVGGSKVCSYVIGYRYGNVPLNLMNVLTQVGEKIFLFNLVSTPENFDEDLPVLEDMLQSFNLTKSSDFLTYEDIANGFKMQYPYDWNKIYYKLNASISTVVFVPLAQNTTDRFLENLGVTVALTCRKYYFRSVCTFSYRTIKIIYSRI